MDGPSWAIELFSGIGGLGSAAAGLLEIVAAFDMSPHANLTYAHNTGMRPDDRNIAGLQAADLLTYKQAGWLLSPPCQPFTRKGHQLDMDDPRNRPLLRLIKLLSGVMPPFILLENVPPFAHSRTHELLTNELRALEYEFVDLELSPIQFGIPNRRLRYFLLARREPLPAQPAISRIGRLLPEYLDSSPDPDLIVDRAYLKRYGRGMNIVEPDSHETACFGASYGRAAKKAGSYLDEGSHVRRFSPTEILRLLHFPTTFSFPSTIPLKNRYRLAGNSVNVATVRYLLKWLLTS
jgi:site-specific DNA-cytosine methylase